MTSFGHFRAIYGVTTGQIRNLTKFKHVCLVICLCFAKNQSLICLSCKDLTVDMSHAYIYSNLLKKGRFCPFWSFLRTLYEKLVKNNFSVFVSEDSTVNMSLAYIHFNVFSVVICVHRNRNFLVPL